MQQLTNHGDNVQEIVSNMALLKPPVALADQSNVESLNFLNNIDVSCQGYAYPDQFYYHVSRLWRDDGVQECYRRANEYPLIDCAK